MLHKETVTPELIAIVKELCRFTALDSFRLVGGTAAALQLGHRISIDIDFFSNEKINKASVARSLSGIYPGIQAFIGTENIRTVINNVRVELYDEWLTPFLTNPVIEEEMRIAALDDIAAFKLEALTERREKKDYIDLFFIFARLGHLEVLQNFNKYNPHLSMKSLVFALGEVGEAQSNKSVMPEMLSPISWKAVQESMLEAAQVCLSLSKQ